MRPRYRRGEVNGFDFTDYEVAGIREAIGACDIDPLPVLHFEALEALTWLRDCDEAAPAPASVQHKKVDVLLKHVEGLKRALPPARVRAVGVQHGRAIAQAIERAIYGAGWHGGSFARESEEGMIAEAAYGYRGIGAREDFLPFMLDEIAKELCAYRSLIRNTGRKIPMGYVKCLLGRFAALTGKTPSSYVDGSAVQFVQICTSAVLAFANDTLKLPHIVKVNGVETVSDWIGLARKDRAFWEQVEAAAATRAWPFRELFGEPVYTRE